MSNVKYGSSKKVTQRNLKIMFWGDTSTRKTEEVLRNFPHVFLIDAEGNSDMCADNPDIPEYLVAKTKDPREAIKIIDDIAAGKIKFDDGSPVETLSIDSWSVIWYVQQEFASTMAEKRAARYNNRDASEANATQLDWGLAKRPMKMITNRMNNSPVKFLVLICRQKDLYDDNPDQNKSKKIGFQPDAVKGTTYEMNLGLHFVNDGTWKYEVSKVQGTLGDIFPMGKTGTKIDYKALFAYADKIRPSVGTEKSDLAVAEDQVSDVGNPKTFASLKEYAISLGIPAEKFGDALKSGGWTQYATSAHDTMEAYLNEWVTDNLHAGVKA